MPDLAERRQLLELGHRSHVAGERVVALTEIGKAVTEPAAGMGDEMAKRRALGRSLVAQLELREEAADRCIEVERAALDRAHDGPRGNRLGDPRDREKRDLIHRYAAR